MASPRDTFIAGVYAPNTALNVTNKVMIVDVNDKIGSIAPTANGQLIIGAAATPPIWNTLTAGAGVTITPGANTITIAEVGPGAGGTAFFNTNAGQAAENNANPANPTITFTGVAPITTAGAAHTVTVGLTQGTNGQLLVGGGATPVWSTIIPGANITLTPAAHSLTIGTTLGAVGLTELQTNGHGVADPVAGAVSIVGGLNINTTGNNGNVITIQTNNFLELPQTTALNNGVYQINGVQEMHAYGKDNTFIGSNAGNFTLTTATSTSNVAMGVNSSNELTSGFDNVGIGFNTLTNLSTGSANTSLGWDSMTTATVGTNNTSIGSNSLSSLVGGRYNIAIGAASAINFSAGETSNIIIGSPGTTGDNATTRLGVTGNGFDGTVLGCFVGGVIPVGYAGTSLMTVTGADKLGIVNNGVGALGQVLMYNNIGNINVGTVNSPNNSVLIANNGINIGLTKNKVAWYAYQNSSTAQSFTSEDSIYIYGTGGGFAKVFDTNNVISGTATGQTLTVTIPITGYYYIQMLACIIPAPEIIPPPIIVQPPFVPGPPSPYTPANFYGLSPLYIYVNGVERWISYDRDLENSSYTVRSGYYSISSIFNAGDILTFGVQLTTVPITVPPTIFWVVGSNTINAYAATSICGYMINPA